MTDGREHEKPLTRSERINIRISITQTVLAVVGIFIGSVALYAALHESDAVRKQLDTSVWPRLAIIRNFSAAAGEEQFSIEIANAGIGPAVVKSFKVTIDDEPLTDWIDLAARVTEAEHVVFSNDTIVASIIRAGTEVEAVRFVAASNDDKEIAEKLRGVVDDGRVVFELCYCSVFEQCWVQLSTSRDPQPVKACPDLGRNEFDG